MEMRNRLPWLAALAALAVCLPAIGGGFVWDDRWTILQSPLRGNPGALPRLLLKGHGWGTMLPPDEGGTYWRPLPALLHGLLLLAIGPHAMPFRILSAAAHAGTSLLLGLWLRRLSPKAAWGAVLFALHPALADAFAWISAFPDLLATGFVIGALMAATTSDGTAKRSSRPLLAGLLVLLALLSKESAIAALLWFPLVWRWTEGAWLPARARPAAAGIAGALVIYLALRAAGPGFSRGAADWPPGVEASRIVLIGRLLLIDIARLLVPLRPTLEPPPWVLARGVAITGLVGIAGASALAILSIVALAHGGRGAGRPAASSLAAGSLAARSPAARSLAAGFLLALTALLPVLQIVPTSDLFGGRFLYLPAAGLLLGIGAAIARARRVPDAALAVLSLLLAVGAGLRASEWRSDTILFGREFERQPRSIRARLQWAGHLLNEGRIGEAAPIVAETAAMAPQHPRIRYQQALVWLNSGRVAQAEATFADLARTWKRTPTLLSNLASAQMRQGRLAEGLATLDEATRGLTPTPGMRNNRGLALRLLGRPADARREFEAAIADDPRYAPARINLIHLLAEVMRDDAAARREADAFLARFPDAPEAASIRTLRGSLQQPAR
ncbi:MAG: tetratricopeptide repeat protein [Candidatus Eisenbacteria bacterium]